MFFILWLVHYVKLYFTYKIYEHLLSILLISNLFPLWSDNVFCMISIFWNLLRILLRPNIWSFMNLPCVPEKTVYPAVANAVLYTFSLVKLFASVWQVFYIFTCLYVLYLYMFYIFNMYPCWGRCVKVSHYVCGFVVFFMYCASCILKALLWVHFGLLYFLNELALYHYELMLFMSGNTSCPILI